MKVKTTELIDDALDWAVAEVLGLSDAWMDDHRVGYRNSPSTDWSLGGPIIEREKISIWPDDACFEWLAEYRFRLQCDDDYFGGPTPLIAAMRCFVASELGDEVEVPEELLT